MKKRTGKTQSCEKFNALAEVSIMRNGIRITFGDDLHTHGLLVDATRN